MAALQEASVVHGVCTPERALIVPCRWVMLPAFLVGYCVLSREGHDLASRVIAHSIIGVLPPTDEQTSSGLSRRLPDSRRNST